MPKVQPEYLENRRLHILDIRRVLPGRIDHRRRCIRTRRRCKRSAQRGQQQSSPHRPCLPRPRSLRSIVAGSRREFNRSGGLGDADAAQRHGVERVVALRRLLDARPGEQVHAHETARRSGLHNA